jgi:single-stranded DNA-binding protein
LFCCDQFVVYWFDILSFLAVQWMGSAGIARNEIRSVAQSVVDAVYALEENVLGFHDNVDESTASSGTKSAMGRTGSKQQTKTPSTSTTDE